MEHSIHTARRVRPFSLLSFLRSAIELRRQRRKLAELDAYLLADAGISPDEARTEALRSLWDVPQSWRA